MIARLTGVVVGSEPNALIIETGGVGYRVFTTNATIFAAEQDRESSLWTYLAVRETALELFGFVGQNELHFFTLLLSVSGIGPKSALAILNLAPVSVLKRAVVAEDASYLTKVAGIGKKNAQKIVLELRDKLGGFETEEPVSTIDTDVLDALSALGYPLADARSALKRVAPDVLETGERVKAAMRELNQLH